MMRSLWIHYYPFRTTWDISSILPDGLLSPQIHLFGDVLLVSSTCINVTVTSSCFYNHLQHTSITNKAPNSKVPFSLHSAWTTIFSSCLDWTISLFSCIRAYFYFLSPFQIINFPPIRTFIKLLGIPLLYIYLY